MASATAALMLSWIVTLAARSSGDAGDRRPDGAEAVGQLGRRGDRRRVESVGAGDGDEVAAVGRAEQLLEAVRRKR